MSQNWILGLLSTFAGYSQGFGVTELSAWLRCETECAFSSSFVVRPLPITCSCECGADRWPVCVVSCGEREVFVVVVVVVWWFESKLWVESRHFQKSFLRFTRLDSNCICNA